MSLLFFKVNKHHSRTGQWLDIFIIFRMSIYFINFCCQYIRAIKYIQSIMPNLYLECTKNKLWKYCHKAPQGNLFKYFYCIISNHRTEIVLRNKNKLKWWYLNCDCENKSNICRNCQILTWNLTIYQCFQPCRVLTPETRLDKYSHLDVPILMLYKCWHPQLTTAIGS